MVGRQVTIGYGQRLGMIHPNMGTMLGFITTDLAIAKDLLQEALVAIVGKTFNMIVDLDTSTNDMVLVLANGLAGNEPINSKEDPAYKIFYEALSFVLIWLKKSPKMAKELLNSLQLKYYLLFRKKMQEGAKAVCNSSLVKTALLAKMQLGSDLAAVGYSGQL